MGGKPNYALIGLFVVILSILSILFIFWLTSFKHREEYNTYVVYMHEEISGLNIDAPVRYNGVKVGYVGSIKLNPNDPQQVILKLKIQEGAPITTSTIASLKSEGVTGVDYIGLKALTPQAPVLQKKPGEKYPVIPAEPSFLVKLGTALQQVTRTIKDFDNNMNDVLSESNRQAIHSILINVGKVTEVLGTQSASINDSIVLMHRLIQNSAHSSEAVTVQLMPQILQVSHQLNAVSANLQELSEVLKRNPSVLIRGRYPLPAGPGEK